MKAILFLSTFLISLLVLGGEVNSWDCRNLEGAKIIAEDGAELGVLGPRWKNHSIFNDSSEHSSTWSSKSIYNTSGEYGNSYSSQSVFNDSASKPPKIISEAGEEIGRLSIGPNWDRTRFNPYDIKYTCDWD